jgi:hypothetical protein
LLAGGEIRFGLGFLVIRRRGDLGGFKAVHGTPHLLPLSWQGRR